MENSCHLECSSFDSNKSSCCSSEGCCAAPEKKRKTGKCHDGESCLKVPKPTLFKSRTTKHKPHSHEVFRKECSEVGTLDLEKGPSVFEHVVLTVHGMTCTGCERKLSRALSGIPSISNVNASLVVSQAEFDINISINSVEDVVDQLERITGFRCERLATKGQQLDVMRTLHMDTIIGRALPPGVMKIRRLDDHTVRIEYDNKIIGARDLHDGYLGAPLRLAAIRPHASVAAGNRHLRTLGFRTILSIILTVPVLVLAWAPLPSNEIVYGSISLALATIIQIFVAGPFYISAIKSVVFSRVIDMDLLIVLSSSTAYIFSVVAFGYLIIGSSLLVGEYFQTTTLLITLIMVGEYVSALARQRAVESISIRSLQATTALLVTNNDTSLRRIDTRLLQYGDIFHVSPDSRIATDGTVVSGRSEVDESMVTGESTPVEKAIGSTVIAGSTNSSGVLNVRVTHLPCDNTISTIAGMVDQAKLSKPKVQEIADRVASRFIPVIIVLTIITFVVWVVIGIKIRSQPTYSAAMEAVTYAIAVLVISCPCAIGLAVPMVIVIAGGVAADHGIVFKTAQTLQHAWKTSHVIFDKTGTLTKSEPVVYLEKYRKGIRDETASILLGLMSNIKHPVSIAVARHLEMQDIRAYPVHSIRTITGKGVEGIANNNVVRAGNPYWLGIEGHPQVQPILSQGFTVLCVVIDDKVHAVFGLEDSLRPEARSLVSSLRARGIAVSIVSGDNEGAVHKFASQLSIPWIHTRARCSPADKQKYVKETMQNSRGAVLFCGDGTNDAVALAQATIGVHVNEGTDIAQGAADVVLVHPTLTGILVLMDLSRAAFWRIVFNFCWAFVYNLFAILLAAGAFVNARIPPQYAGLGEVVSVLPVIAAAFHLRYVTLSQPQGPKTMHQQTLPEPARSPSGATSTALATLSRSLTVP
jgi:Cd2+-exporting ATPase